MTRLIPLAIALAYALLLWQFSVWRTNRMLHQRSRPLDEPILSTETQALAEALNLPSIEVRVFDIEPVNGLAAPDGRIFLTQGFIDAYHAGKVSAPEMAAVIAHELGHVALGHLRRRMIDFTGQNAVFLLLTAFLSRFLPFIGIWIANLISVALMARLSRRDEFEADAFATALLIKAGIGAEAQITLFDKLDALTQNGNARPPAWLLSHPASAERIAAIEANIARWTQPGTA